MRIATLPRVDRRLLPADGAWTELPWWRESSGRLAPPEVARAATDALLRVFSTAWVRNLPAGDRIAHPFEHWLTIGGGVALLLQLGWSLHLCGEVPRQLRERLRSDAAFDSAASEVRAAGLLRMLGADRIEWPPSGATPSADLRAWAGTERVAVEVKQLNDGDEETRFARVDWAFEEGFQLGSAMEMRGVSPSTSSHATITTPIDALEKFARRDLPDVGAAKEEGRRYGTRLGEFLASFPEPGSYELDPALAVRVFVPQTPNPQQGHERRVLAPGGDVFGRRATRLVRQAAAQLRTEGGVVVLERRWPPRWPPGVVEFTRRALEEEHDLVAVGAVVFREDALVVGASRSTETVTVIPGRGWERLPEWIRRGLPAACGSCGVRHTSVDTLQPRAAEAAQPEHQADNDAGRLDRWFLESTRTPAERLRAALGQLRLAYSLARANIRERLPDASDAQREREFMKWLLRDG